MTKYGWEHSQLAGNVPNLVRYFKLEVTGFWLQVLVAGYLLLVAGC